MQIDLAALAENKLLFLIGVIWLSIHVIVISKLLKAPYFILMVGS
jgi:hypothetical protein